MFQSYVLYSARSLDGFSFDFVSSRFKSKLVENRDSITAGLILLFMDESQVQLLPMHTHLAIPLTLLNPPILM